MYVQNNAYRVNPRVLVQFVKELTRKLNAMLCKAVSEQGITMDQVQFQYMP
jgi:hypothetical protein